MPLARITHDQWMMRAILMTCLDKPVHTQEHPDFRFQIWSWFESGYGKTCRWLGGVAPKVTGSGE